MWLRTEFVVLLSGPVAAGKTTLARELGNRGLVRLSTRALILTELPDTRPTRSALQEAGEKLDQHTGGSWVARGLTSLLRTFSEAQPAVVDSVRTAEQVGEIRRVVAPVLHVHITAPLAVLTRRYEQTFRGLGELPTYEMVAQNTTEAQIEHLAALADLRIDSAQNTVAETVSQVSDLLTRSR